MCIVLCYGSDDVGVLVLFWVMLVWGGRCVGRVDYDLVFWCSVDCVVVVVLCFGK